MKEKKKKIKTEKQWERERNVNYLYLVYENIRHSSYIDFYKNIKFNIKKFI